MFLFFVSTDLDSGTSKKYRDYPRGSYARKILCSMFQLQGVEKNWIKFVFRL